MGGQKEGGTTRREGRTSRHLLFSDKWFQLWETLLCIFARTNRYKLLVWCEGQKQKTLEANSRYDAVPLWLKSVLRILFSALFASFLPHIIKIGVKPQLTRSPPVIAHSIPVSFFMRIIDIWWKAQQLLGGLRPHSQSCTKSFFLSFFRFTANWWC